jgi:hypothetical protein
MLFGVGFLSMEEFLLMVTKINSSANGAACAKRGPRPGNKARNQNRALKGRSNQIQHGFAPTRSRENLAVIDDASFGDSQGLGHNSPCSAERKNKRLYSVFRRCVQARLQCFSATHGPGAVGGEPNTPAARNIFFFGI